MSGNESADTSLVLRSDTGETWARLKSLALEAVSSPHTRRAYERGLDDFLKWHTDSSEVAPLFSKASVNAWRTSLEKSGLSSSTINTRLSAVRKLVGEAADNGLVDPQHAAGILKIRGVARRGARIGNWMSQDQAESLIQAPGQATVTGKRDRALIGLLIGCGLRRSELVSLTVEHIQMRDARWIIVDIAGKGNRVRSVPMPGWAKSLVDQWTAAAEITSGSVFRPVNKAGRVSGDSLANAKAVWVCVQKYAAAVGSPALAPHDLRRTYAKLAHRGRAAIEQIRLSLGHASIQTTERYLGVEQDLQDAPCDHLGLRVDVPAA